MKKARFSPTEVIFYCFPPRYNMEPKSFPPDSYSWRFWRPLGLSVVPRGLSTYPFLIWSLFHHLKIFSNGNYCLFLAFSGSTIIHRAVITPSYFRFPFMGEKDLQIGDVWTHPDHRRRGLATYSLKEIVERLRVEGRRFWYVVDAGNTASIRVAEKAGFIRCGEGLRTKRFGLNLFGAFEMRSQFEPVELSKEK